MKDATRKEVLLFYIYCFALNSVAPDKVSATKKILLEMQKKFFEDSKFFQPKIAFTDINNVVNEIFRYTIPKYRFSYAIICELIFSKWQPR